MSGIKKRYITRFIKMNYKCPFDGSDFSCDGQGKGNASMGKGTMIEGSNFEHDGRVSAGFQGSDGSYYVAGIDKKSNKKKVYRIKPSGDPAVDSDVARSFAAKFATKNDDLDGGYDKLEEIKQNNRGDENINRKNNIKKVELVELVQKAFEMHLNARCKVSEQQGTGPGSCGGKVAGESGKDSFGAAVDRAQSKVKSLDERAAEHGKRVLGDLADRFSKADKALKDFKKSKANLESPRNKAKIKELTKARDSIGNQMDRIQKSVDKLGGKKVVDEGMKRAPEREAAREVKKNDPANKLKGLRDTIFRTGNWEGNEGMRDAMLKEANAVLENPSSSGKDYNNALKQLRDRFNDPATKANYFSSTPKDSKAKSVDEEGMKTREEENKKAATKTTAEKNYVHKEFNTTTASIKELNNLVGKVSDMYTESGSPDEFASKVRETLGKVPMMVYLVAEDMNGRGLTKALEDYDLLDNDDSKVYDKFDKINNAAFKKDIEWKVNSDATAVFS
jgi:hypothetical protein